MDFSFLSPTRSQHVMLIHRIKDFFQINDDILTIGFFTLRLCSGKANHSRCLLVYCLHNTLDIRYGLWVLIWVYLDIGYRYGFLVILWHLPPLLFFLHHPHQLRVAISTSTLTIVTTTRSPASVWGKGAKNVRKVFGLLANPHITLLNLDIFSDCQNIVLAIFRHFRFG